MKEKEPDTLSEIRTIKSCKVMTYPYYPVADTLTEKGINFLFRLDTSGETILVITPFKNNDILLDTRIVLDQLPKRSVNLLKILSLQQEISVNRKGVQVKQIEFVLGFNSGFMIRCVVKNEGKQRSKLAITDKFNRDPLHRDSLMGRMTKTIFSSDQWYKLQLDKPVRSFTIVDGPKYRYSYLIGNRLILTSIMTEQTQSDILKTYSSFDWEAVKKGGSLSMHKNVVAVHGIHFKAFQNSSTMIIDWETQIGAYAFNSIGQLIIADNSSNTISIYDARVGLTLVKSYKFDLDVKKLAYQKISQEEEMLLVMPYDNHLYMINLVKDQVSAFRGHKSYVTQASITPNRIIISGGCDHRIGLKKLEMIKKWAQIHRSSENVFNINSDEVEKQPFSETYFLGVFSNTNASRNNDYDFGFGNFLPLSLEHKSYAFFSYDFWIKLYTILA